MALDFETPSVIFQVAGAIATITLNRPHEGNAVTPDLARGMSAAWEEVKRNPAVLAAIVTGAGEKHFCTGASVSDLREGPSGLLVDGSLRDGVRFSSRQNEVWKPVICVVNGLVNGAGLHFVVDADIVVSARSAAFMDTHTSVGQVGAIENIGLARRTTLGAALLLTLVGRSYRMTAERAHQLGLVDILEDDASSAMKTGLELAAAIARNSPRAVMLSKQAIWGAMEKGYQAAMEDGWELLKSQWRHPDFSEGPKAFIEKRTPVWLDPKANE